MKGPFPAAGLMTAKSICYFTRNRFTRIKARERPTWEHDERHCQRPVVKLE